MPLRYAPNGYAYLVVDTPQIFLEYLLPLDPEEMNDDERVNRARLEIASDLHAAPIVALAYQRG